MRPFTLSEAERVEACPGSAALPRVASTGEPALRGKHIHAFARAALEVGRDAALEQAPEELRAELAEVDLEGLPQDPGAYSGEVAFAYDPIEDTAYELGRDLERDYDGAGAAETDIVGAADYVALLGDDAVAVDDLKTGHKSVTRARKNLQLGGLAMAAARAYGRSRARVRLRYRREDGGRFDDEAWLDAFDFHGIARRLRKSVERVARARAAYAAGEVPELAEGVWCKHCPCRKLCPAKMTLARQVVTAPETALTVAKGFALRELSGPELGVLHDRLERAQGLITEIQGALDTMAREHPIDFGDGRIYGVRREPWSTFNAKIAHEVLERYIDALPALIDGKPRPSARELADSIIEMKTSQADVRRALKKVATKSRSGNRMFDEVKEQIRDAGGVIDKPRTPLKVYRKGDDGQLELVAEEAAS